MSESPTNPNSPPTKYGGVSKAKYYRDKKKRAFKEIETQGEIDYAACEHCFKHNIRCVVMSSSKGVVCASCASKGIKCVNYTWSSLDKTRATEKKEIEESLNAFSRMVAEHAAAQQKLLAKIERHRQALELAERRAKAKTVCLLDELEEENEAQRIRNGGLSDGELEELSRNMVAYNNAAPENVDTEIWCSWDDARRGPDLSSDEPYVARASFHASDPVAQSVLGSPDGTAREVASSSGGS